MSAKILLYGATGYSGREIAARLAGHADIILAGREPEGLADLSARLGLPWRSFAVEDAPGVMAALADVGVLLNAAGPYVDTAMPLAQACLQSRTHYLDIGGEWPVFRALTELDEVARQAGVMLLPGVGLTIAASDCLLARAVELWPDTHSLHLGISRAHSMSRGSARSAARLFERGVVIRENGELKAVPLGGAPRSFDFGEGLRDAVAMSWADVVTAERTTGVPTISVYSEVPWWQRAAYRASGLYASLSGTGAWKKAGARIAEAWPSEPAGNTRQEGAYVMAVEALDPWRRSRSLRLRTLDGYGTTVLTAAQAAENVTMGMVEAGFQTPAALFGSHFIETCGAGTFEPATGVHAA